MASTNINSKQRLNELDRNETLTGLNNVNIRYPSKDNILIYSEDNSLWKNTDFSIGLLPGFDINNPEQSQTIKYNSLSGEFVNDFVDLQNLEGTCAGNPPTDGILAWQDTCWNAVEMKIDIECLSTNQTYEFINSLLSTPGIGGETGNFNVCIYPSMTPWTGTDIVFNTANSVLSFDGAWIDLTPSTEPTKKDRISIKTIELIEVKDFDVSTLTFPSISLENVKMDYCAEKFCGWINSFCKTFDSGNNFEIMANNNKKYISWNSGSFGTGTPPLYVNLLRGTTSGYLPIYSTYRIKTQPSSSQNIKVFITTSTDFVPFNKISEWDPQSGTYVINLFSISPPSTSGFLSGSYFTPSGRMFTSMDQIGFGYYQAAEVWKDGAPLPNPPGPPSSGTYSYRIIAPNTRYGISQRAPTNGGPLSTGAVITGIGFLDDVNKVRFLSGVSNASPSLQDYSGVLDIFGNPNEAMGNIDFFTTVLADGNKVPITQFPINSIPPPGGLPVNNYRRYSLVYYPPNGLFYTVFSRAQASSGNYPRTLPALQLRSIEPNAPYTETVISSLTIGSFRGMSLGPNNVMYIAGSVGPVGSELLTLYTIDPLTGNVTPYGAIAQAATESGEFMYNSVSVFPEFLP